MYTKRDMVYAEPYKVLVGAGFASVYQARGKEGDYAEVDCPLEDMSVRSGVAVWGGGLGSLWIPPERTYASIKARLVKMRYSNDDQLAILCNGDEEETRRMQSWREWASDVARRICERLGLIID